MKKVILGMFVLGSLTFGRFEKEYGFQEIKKDEKQIVLESDNCTIIRFGMKLSKKGFYDMIESAMQGKEYKINDMSATVVWVDAGRNMIFCNATNVGEFIIIIPDNNKAFRKAYEYLEANDILSSDNGFYLSSVGLSMTLGN